MRPLGLQRIVTYLSVFDAAELRDQMCRATVSTSCYVTDPGEHNEYTAARVLDVLWKLL